MSIESEVKRILNARADMIGMINRKGGTIEGEPTLANIATAIRNLPDTPTLSYGEITYWKDFNITWGGGWSMPIVDTNKFSAIALTICPVPYTREGGGSLEAQYEAGVLRLGVYDETIWDYVWIETTPEEAGIDVSGIPEWEMGYDNYYMESWEKVGEGTVALQSEEDIEKLVAEIEDYYGGGQYELNGDKTVSLSDGTKFKYGYITGFEFGTYDGEYPDQFLCAPEIETVSGCENVVSVGNKFMAWVRPHGEGIDVWENMIRSFGNFNKLVSAGDDFLAGRQNLETWFTSFPALVTVGDNFCSDRYGMGGGWGDSFDIPAFPKLASCGDFFMSGIYGLNFPYEGYEFSELETIGENFLGSDNYIFQNVNSATISFPKLTRMGGNMFYYAYADQGGWDITLDMPALVSMGRGFMANCYSYGGKPLKLKLGANFAEFGDGSSEWYEADWLTGSAFSLFNEIETEATNPPTDKGYEQCFSNYNDWYGGDNYVRVTGSQADKWLETYANNDYRNFYKEEF